MIRITLNDKILNSCRNEEPLSHRKRLSLKLLPSCELQGLFFQEVMVTPSGSGWSMPSQYTPPSLVSATFVKTVFLIMVAMALGLVFAEVPGATPKKPFSGLMARRLPSIRNQREMLSKCLTVCFGTQLIGLHNVKSLSPCSSNFIQAMSSPTHSTFQPGSVGQSMARFVFPQALGNAAAMYFFSPAGLVMPRI